MKCETRRNHCLHEDPERQTQYCCWCNLEIDKAGNKVIPFRPACEGADHAPRIDAQKRDQIR